MNLERACNLWEQAGGEAQVGGQSLRRVMPIGGKLVEFGQRTMLMGILNVTPDSFSDGGRYNNVTAALELAKKHIAEGADMVDVGGQSSRPGATRLSSAMEAMRTVPIIKYDCIIVQLPNCIGHKHMLIEDNFDSSDCDW